MRCPNSLFACILTLLLLAAPALHAQDADSTTYTEDTSGIVAAEESAEAEAPHTVTYNKAAPSEAQWQRLTADEAFRYRNEREFTKPEQPSERDQWLLRFLEGMIRFFSSAAGHLVLWGLLAALVGFVLYRILAGDGRIFGRRDHRPVATGQEEATVSEDDLLHGNWEEKLREALDAGNTRMAIRYSYMYLLQLLQARDLIEYRQDKTNSTYYQELSGQAVRQPFRQLTRDYEYAWYGNFLPSTPAFDAYMQAFNGVKKELGAS